jgi:hypothetical protein
VSLVSSPRRGGGRGTTWWVLRPAPRKHANNDATGGKPVAGGSLARRRRYECTHPNVAVLLRKQRANKPQVADGLRRASGWPVSSGFGRVGALLPGQRSRVQESLPRPWRGDRAAGCGRWSGERAVSWREGVNRPANRYGPDRTVRPFGLGDSTHTVRTRRADQHRQHIGPRPERALGAPARGAAATAAFYLRRMRANGTSRRPAGAGAWRRVRSALAHGAGCGRHWRMAPGAAGTGAWRRVRPALARGAGCGRAVAGGLGVGGRSSGRAARSSLAGADSGHP